MDLINFFVLIIIFIVCSWLIRLEYRLSIEKEPKTQEERIRKIMEELEEVGKKHIKEAKEKSDLENLKDRVAALEEECFYNKEEHIKK
jgi:biopolymer transport protein ExbD